MGGVWVWSYKYREGPIQIRGREVPEKLLTFALLVFTLVVFYLSSATAVLLWLLGIALVCMLTLSSFYEFFHFNKRLSFSNLLVIFFHALLMTPQPVDEFGFGITTGQAQPSFNIQENPQGVSPV